MCPAFNMYLIYARNFHLKMCDHFLAGCPGQLCSKNEFYSPEDYNSDHITTI